MKNSNFYKYYSFDNFVVGDSNRLAYLLAVEATEYPSTLGNVFYIYGKNGLGKTHLLNAIRDEILRKNSSKKVLYITSENFTNRLMNSLIDSNYNDELFLKKYKDIDVLIIDDIHFLAGKKIVQEVFFHIFDSLYQHEKRIILSSDRPPSDIDLFYLMEEKIKSWFDSVLFVNIEMPDYELKFSILKELVQGDKLDIDTEILQRIANFNNLTIRDLTGIINQIHAYCQFYDCSATWEIVDEILNQYKGEKL